MYHEISQSETFKYALFLARNLLIEDEAQYAMLRRILQTNRLNVHTTIHNSVVNIDVRYVHQFVTDNILLDTRPLTIMEALFGEKEPTFIVYGNEDMETMNVAIQLLRLNTVHATGKLNFPRSITFSGNKAIVHRGVIDGAIHYPYLPIKNIVWKYLTTTHPTLLLNWDEHPNTPDFINCDSTLFGVYDYDATDNRYVYRCSETEWQQQPRTTEEQYPKHLFHIIFNSLGSDYAVHNTQQFINLFRLHHLFECRHNVRTRNYPLTDYSNTENRTQSDMYKLGYNTPYKTILNAFVINDNVIKTCSLRGANYDGRSMSDFAKLPVLEYLSSSYIALDLHDLKTGDTVTLRNGRLYPVNVEHGWIGNYSFMEYHDNGFHVEDYSLDIVTVNDLKNKYNRSEPIAKRKRPTRRTTE